MKNENNKIDVKSVITIGLVFTLIVIVLALVAGVILGIITPENALVSSIILLFTNCLTACMTYFFTKKTER